MRYPSRNQYNTHIKHLDKFVFDKALRDGRPMMREDDPRFLLTYNGGKAVVYKVNTPAGRNYALKCWVEDLGDLKKRYREIDNFLQDLNLPYFVDFAYKESGIMVDGGKYPILRMDWVDGFSLDDYISENISNKNRIRRLADDFLNMTKVLHKKNISHGDLQHGNIKVNNNGKIFLVDYDSLYIPSLSNELDKIKGLPSYQHPSRFGLINLSPKADYFSEVVIYVSLLAIAENPDLWKDIKDSQRLIFSEKDFANPFLSPTLEMLGNRHKFSYEVNYLADAIRSYYLSQTDINSLVPLEEVLEKWITKRESFPTLGVAVEVQDSPTGTTESVCNELSDSGAKTDQWRPFERIREPENQPALITPPNPWDGKFSSTTDATGKAWNGFSGSGTKADPWRPFEPTNGGENFNGAQSPHPLSEHSPNPFTLPSLWDMFGRTLDRILTKTVNTITDATGNVWDKLSGNVTTTDPWSPFEPNSEGGNINGSQSSYDNEKVWSKISRSTSTIANSIWKKIIRLLK